MIGSIYFRGDFSESYDYLDDYRGKYNAKSNKKFVEEMIMKLRKHLVLRVVIVVFILWLGVHALVLFYMSIDRQCISIDYNCYEQRGSNGRYEGIIEKQSVTIKDADGYVSGCSLSELGMFPHEIILGKDCYYLVHYAEDESEETVLMQLDYESSAIKGSLTDKGILRVFSVKDAIFVLQEKPDEDFSQLSNGDYANCYIQEDKFDDGVQKIKEDDREWLEKEMGFMYSQGEVFSRVGEIGLGTSELFYYDTAANLRNIENRNKKMEILSQLDNEINGDANEVYYVRCYVIGEKLYGVCNTLKSKFVEEDMRIADVEASYFFTYDNANGLCIEYSQEDVAGIAYLGEKPLYIREQEVCLRDIVVEKEDVIYTIRNKNNLAIEITKGSLMLRAFNSWKNEGETYIMDIHMP